MLYTFSATFTQWKKGWVNKFLPPQSHNSYSSFLVCVSHGIHLNCVFLLPKYLDFHITICCFLLTLFRVAASFSHSLLVHLYPFYPIIQFINGLDTSCFETVVAKCVNTSNLLFHPPSLTMQALQLHNEHVVSKFRLLCISLIILNCPAPLLCVFCFSKNKRCIIVWLVD